MQLTLMILFYVFVCSCYPITYIEFSRLPRVVAHLLQLGPQRVVLRGLRLQLLQRGAQLLLARLQTQYTHIIFYNVSSNTAK